MRVEVDSAEIASGFDDRNAALCRLPDRVLDCEIEFDPDVRGTPWPGGARRGWWYRKDGVGEFDQQHVTAHTVCGRDEDRTGDIVEWEVESALKLFG